MRYVFAGGHLPAVQIRMIEQQMDRSQPWHAPQGMPNLSPSSLQIVTGPLAAPPRALPVWETALHQLPQTPLPSFAGLFREEIDSPELPGLLYSPVRLRGAAGATLQQQGLDILPQQRVTLQEEPDQPFQAQGAEVIRGEPESPGIRPAQPLVLPLDDEEAQVVEEEVRPVPSASGRALEQDSSTESEELTSFAISSQLKRTYRPAEQDETARDKLTALSSDDKRTESADIGKAALQAKKPRAKRRRKAAQTEAASPALPRTRPMLSVAAFKKTSQSKKAKLAARASRVRSEIRYCLLWQHGFPKSPYVALFCTRGSFQTVS